MINKCVLSCLASMLMSCHLLVAQVNEIKAYDPTPPNARRDSTINDPNSTLVPTVFIYVEQMPEFPGGTQAMQRFLMDNVVYPDSSRIKGINGKVFIRFIVDKEGFIRQPEVMRGIAPDIDAEALRVISSMPPWKPGKQNGQNVDVYFSLPITFSLQ